MSIKNSRNAMKEFYVCPVCKALCVEGHDEDFQQHCSVCCTTFLTTTKKVVALHEDIIKNNYICHERAGWISYKLISD